MAWYWSEEDVKAIKRENEGLKKELRKAIALVNKKQRQFDLLVDRHNTQMKTLEKRLVLYKEKLDGHTKRK